MVAETVDRRTPAVLIGERGVGGGVGGRSLTAQASFLPGAEKPGMKQAAPTPGSESVSCSSRALENENP